MSQTALNYRYDGSRIVLTAVGQRALQEGVATSLLYWCRKNSRNDPDHSVVDWLVRSKLENDQLELKIRASLAKFLAATALLAIREEMRSQEAELQAKYSP